MAQALRNHVSPVFDCHTHFESDDESGISAFGYPKTNHGWIECISKSFPGQTYYFNVDTCCSTWNRPVSRFVPTRRNTRPVNLMSEEDFLDDAPIAVSDIENENDYDDYDEEINPVLSPDADDVTPPAIKVKGINRSRETKIYAEVLFKLYHCYSCNLNDNEVESVAPLNCESFEDDSSEKLASIQPEACYSSGSDSEMTISKPGTSPQDTKSLETSPKSYESFVEIPREDKERHSELDCFRILRTNNSKIENLENPSNISASSVEELNDDSREIGLSFDDDEEEELENEEDEKTAKSCLFLLPRLKAIEFADLTRPRKSRKSAKARKYKTNKNHVIAKKNPLNKMIKIVCEVNGVKTVNYDYLEPELPSGVKMSNLSGSESSSSYDAWYSQENQKMKDNKGSNERKTLQFFDDIMNFREPDLSDPSSSSVSSLGLKT